MVVYGRALGCILYALCYLKLPFQEGGALAILADRIPYPSNPDALSEDAITLLKYLLSFDPEARPSAPYLIKAAVSLMNEEALPHYELSEIAKQRRAAREAAATKHTVISKVKKAPALGAVPPRAMIAAGTSSVAAKRLAAMKGRNVEADVEVTQPVTGGPELVFFDFTAAFDSLPPTLPSAPIESQFLSTNVFVNETKDLRQETAAFNGTSGDQLLLNATTTQASSASEDVDIFSLSSESSGVMLNSAAPTLDAHRNYVGFIPPSGEATPTRISGSRNTSKLCEVTPSASTQLYSLKSSNDFNSIRGPPPTLSGASWESSDFREVSDVSSLSTAAEPSSTSKDADIFFSTPKLSSKMSDQPSAVKRLDAFNSFDGLLSSSGKTGSLGSPDIKEAINFNPPASSSASKLPTASKDANNSISSSRLSDSILGAPDQPQAVRRSDAFSSFDGLLPSSGIIAPSSASWGSSEVREVADVSSFSSAAEPSSTSKDADIFFSTPKLSDSGLKVPDAFSIFNGRLPLSDKSTPSGAWLRSSEVKEAAIVTSSSALKASVVLLSALKPSDTALKSLDQPPAVRLTNSFSSFDCLPPSSGEATSSGALWRSPEVKEAADKTSSSAYVRASAAPGDHDHVLSALEVTESAPNSAHQAAVVKRPSAFSNFDDLLPTTEAAGASPVLWGSLGTHTKATSATHSDTFSDADVFLHDSLKPSNAVPKQPERPAPLTRTDAIGRLDVPDPVSASSTIETKETILTATMPSTDKANSNSDNADVFFPASQLAETAPEVPNQFSIGSRLEAFSSFDSLLPSAAVPVPTSVPTSVPSESGESLESVNCSLSLSPAEMSSSFNRKDISLSTRESFEVDSNLSDQLSSTNTLDAFSDLADILLSSDVSKPVRLSWKKTAPSTEVAKLSNSSPAAEVSSSQTKAEMMLSVSKADEVFVKESSLLLAVRRSDAFSSFLLPSNDDATSAAVSPKLFIQGEKEQPTPGTDDLSIKTQFDSKDNSLNSREPVINARHSIDFDVFFSEGSPKQTTSAASMDTGARSEVDESLSKENKIIQETAAPPEASTLGVPLKPLSQKSSAPPEAINLGVPLKPPTQKTAAPPVALSLSIPLKPPKPQKPPRQDVGIRRSSFQQAEPPQGTSS